MSFPTFVTSMVVMLLGAVTAALLIGPDITTD
jgi:hypothetical protein